MHPRSLHTTLLALPLLAPLAVATVHGAQPSCVNVTAAQVAGTPAANCRALPQPCLATMRPEAFEGFSKECVANLDGNAIQGINAKQISHMPPDAFQGWSSNIEYMGPACGGWTADQAGNLTDEHACEALGQDCFAALTSDAYAGFTFSCVSNWRDNELGGSVTAKDLAKMSPASVAGLNDHDMSAFSDQCAGFRYLQVVQLSELACTAISPDCIQKMSTRACAGFAYAKSPVCQALSEQCTSEKEQTQSTLDISEEDFEATPASLIEHRASSTSLGQVGILFVVIATLGFFGVRYSRIFKRSIKYKSIHW